MVTPGAKQRVVVVLLLLLGVLAPSPTGSTTALPSKPSSPPSTRWAAGPAGRADDGEGDEVEPDADWINRPSLQNRMLKEVKGVRSLLKGLGHRAVREAKLYLSSDWENVLLQATRPNDQRPESDVVEQFLDTVATFIRDGDLHSVNNPYRVTLRKLWAKMIEPDPRTCVKAFFMLHTLLRLVDAEDAALFKSLMVQMSKETCRKSRARYFSKNSLFHWPDPEAPFAEFAQHYATYVLRRASMFTGDFEELRAVGTAALPADDVVARLLKAKKLILAALACTVSSEAESDLALACLEDVARDVRELFILLDAKLTWLAERKPAVFRSWSEAETTKLIGHFAAFRVGKFGEVKAFLKHSNELLDLYSTTTIEPLRLPRVPPALASADDAPPTATKAKSKPPPRSEF